MNNNCNIMNISSESRRKQTRVKPVKDRKIHYNGKGDGKNE